MTQPTRLPRVRTERLLVQDVLDEVVVYDLDRNKESSPFLVETLRDS